MKPSLNALWVNTAKLYYLLWSSWISQKKKTPKNFLLVKPKLRKEKLKTKNIVYLDTTRILER